MVLFSLHHRMGRHHQVTRTRERFNFYIHTLKAKIVQTELVGLFLCDPDETRMTVDTDNIRLREQARIQRGQNPQSTTEVEDVRCLSKMRNGLSSDRLIVFVPLTVEDRINR